MATVKFYLSRPRDKSGALKKVPVPIILKFTKNRAGRFELSTGEQIPPQYWNAKSKEAKPSFTGHVELNQSLSRIKNELIQLWRENKSIDIPVLKQMAKNIIRHGDVSATVSRRRLVDVLQLFISQYEKDKDPKTVKKYKALKSKIELFNLNVDIAGVDLNFYDTFKAFLFDKGLFDATVYKYFTNLSTVLRWALKRGFDVNNAFENWEIIKRRYQPISLTLAELEQLEALEITPLSIKQHVKFKKHARGDQADITARAFNIARDYLILECRTGQRISDLKRFNIKDVSGHNWTFHPKKGNRLSTRKITLPFNTAFTHPAWLILEKYSFNLPPASEQKLNENIKRVCEMAGITQQITAFRWKQNQRVPISGKKFEFISTHTGRKTFITIALQYMPPKLVKDLAGIESYETLKHYEDVSDTSIAEQYLNTIPGTIMRKAL